MKTPTIAELKEIEELESSPRLGKNFECSQLPPILTLFSLLDDRHDHLTSGNVSKTMLNNAPSPDELPSVESSDGPISIQIVSSDSSIEHVKDDPKLPAVSKVHIKLEEERRSSSEDEMTVNIYNVTKSVVTLEKTSQVTVSSIPVEAKPPSPPTVKPDVVSVSSPPPSRVEVKVEKKEAEIREDLRPQSPLWTYTLPAPPVFADSNVNDKQTPTDRQKNGDKYFSDMVSTDCTETILSDSNTTVISAETQIHPIIVDRKPRDEAFIMTPKDYTKTADDESEKSTEIITSDLEDGYLGNGNLVSIESPEPAVETLREEKKMVIEDFKRSRLLISRSDSFHSIGQGRSFDAAPRRSPMSPPQRSTSFLSLVQSQKAEMRLNKSSFDSSPYSRQKSSSELSISDVPSLQSLEVIKNILNSSRKNSLQDPEPKEEKVVVLREQTPPVEIKLEEVVKKMEEISKKSEMTRRAEEVSRQSEERSMKAERKPSPVVEAKPAETQWRYTGPPKINLGTWSDRPKVEVAIAADRDYKFGPVTSTTYPRETKVQETQSKRHTIHISNERVVKDEPVKFTKPKVLGVEYKKDVSPPHAVRERESSVEIVTKPTRTVVNIKPRPMSLELSNNYAQIVTQNSTSPSAVSYNRLNSNAKKFTPVVRGFQLNNIKEGADQVDSSAVKKPVEVVEKFEKKTVEPPSVPSKPSFLRSTSSGDIGRKMKFTPVESKTEEEASSLDYPFSQTGLRKTGLKEKFLSNDQKTKSMFGRVVDEKEEGFVRKHQPEHFVEKMTMRSLSHPVPPKPPTAPPMNHHVTFRKSAPVDLDTRDQLLDAIKNFNKHSLRHK